MARSIHGTLTDALNVGHFSADSMVGEIIRNLTAAGYMIVDAPGSRSHLAGNTREELIALNTRLNEKLHGAKDERDEHASKVTELRGTIARQASDMGEANRQITALEARIRSIDERKVAALESEVANFTMMNSVQQRQITKLRGIIERDRTDLAAKGDLKRANKTIAVRAMEARINELKGALEGKRVRIDELWKNNSLLRKSNSRQYSELSSLQASYALSERKVAGLTTSLTLANDEIARLQPLFHARPGAANHYEAATGRNIKPRPFPTVGQRLSELETKVDMVAKTIEDNHANWRWS